MTISTTTPQVTYIGNNATTGWTFSFVGVTAADLQVVVTDLTSGNQTLLNPVLYSVAINPASPGQIWGIGGTVTYPLSGSPLTTGSSISIIRMVPYTQTISLTNQGALFPQSVETGLDLLELQIQQLALEVLYSIKVPTSDVNPPAVLPAAGARANGYLGFDVNGDPTIFFTTLVPINPGTFVTPRRILCTGTTTQNLTSMDSFRGVAIYQTGPATTTVQLPTGYGPFPIFDAGLNATSYPITILPPGGLLINGQASYKLIYNGQSVTLYNDGTQILIG